MKRVYYIVIFLGICLSTFADEDKDECFVEHNILWKGKEISFSLPCYYTNENIADKFDLPQYAETRFRYSEFVFFSTLNDNCFFVFSIVNDSIDFAGNPNIIQGEELLDTIIAQMIENHFFYDPFAEQDVISKKKRTEDDRAYYFLITLRRHTFWYDGKNDKLIFLPDEITSSFSYITHFGTNRYVFRLTCKECVQDFSYETKRRVLESIKIKNEGNVGR